jgi:hypothetical protein
MDKGMVVLASTSRAACTDACAVVGLDFGTGTAAVFKTGGGPPGSGRAGVSGVKANAL